MYWGYWWKKKSVKAALIRDWSIPIAVAKRMWLQISGPIELLGGEICWFVSTRPACTNMLVGP